MRTIIKPKIGALVSTGNTVITPSAFPTYAKAKKGASVLAVLTDAASQVTCLTESIAHIKGKPAEVPPGG